jgi:hypothetical protein
MRVKGNFFNRINAVSDFQKKFLTATPNQWLSVSRPAPIRGVAQRHEARGGMRWTRRRRKTALL